MKYSEFYKLIEAAGWTISGGTNHYKYVHPDFDYFIPVGRHEAKEVPPGTLNKMMKQAGLKGKKEKKRTCKSPPLPSGSGINWSILKHLIMKILATIEKASDGGYGIYAEPEGLVGYGLTEEEAKADFLSVLEEQATFYKEKRGEFPSWYDSGLQVEYRYDLSGFFLRFPFINASEFASYVGINASLMRKYKSGIVKASERQKEQIQAKYVYIFQNLEWVRF